MKVFEVNFDRNSSLKEKNRTILKLSGFYKLLDKQSITVLVGVVHPLMCGVLRIRGERYRIFS